MKREPLLAEVPALPPQPITRDVLREKYLKDGEQTEKDLLRRVASRGLRARRSATHHGHFRSGILRQRRRHTKLLATGATFLVLALAAALPDAGAVEQPG